MDTLVANTSSLSGGGLYVMSSTRLISNSIVAFNSSGVYARLYVVFPRNNCVYHQDGIMAADFGTDRCELLGGDCVERLSWQQAVAHCQGKTA